MNKAQQVTHGIVHAGFRGFRWFVARKKSWCKLIGNRLVSRTTPYHQPLSLSVKSQPHKQHIWFLPTHEPTLKKPKELFFANARQKQKMK